MAHCTNHGIGFANNVTVFACVPPIGPLWIFGYAIALLVLCRPPPPYLLVARDAVVEVPHPQHYVKVRQQRGGVALHRREGQAGEERGAAAAGGGGAGRGLGRVAGAAEDLGSRGRRVGEEGQRRRGERRKGRQHASRGRGVRRGRGAGRAEGCGDPGQVKAASGLQPSAVLQFVPDYKTSSPAEHLPRRC